MPHCKIQNFVATTFQSRHRKYFFNLSGMTIIITIDFFVVSCVLRQFTVFSDYLSQTPNELKIFCGCELSSFY